MYALWMISGARQATTCKKNYLKALISQEIGWFDTNNQSELASNFAIQTSAYQNGVGEKIGTLIAPFSSVASGVIIAFLTGWRMSLLVFFVVLPALGLSGGFFIYVISNYYHKQRESYVDAGQAAENAITSIKTVKQLNG
jgi:ATP-binding cassette subfamily B (MDR/TAP) protein 1